MIRRPGLTSAPASRQISHLAGWLFADLLLVLVLVVLGGQAVVASPDRGDSDETVRDVRRRTGMIPDSVNVPLLTDQRVADSLSTPGRSGRAAAERALRNRLDAALAKEKRKAAMVFVWGSNGGCSGCARTNHLSSAYAKSAMSVIRRHRHPLLPTDPVFHRAYMDLNAPSGTLRLEIFFYYPD
ncbi:hypothetical protein ABZW18_18885 [Streptomyces sp. NPDC004647]|uniref:hypothetical protein n=1 Tax=Streptomyces sp. NPDC004647 TaxID=3154671 RepID=UPI0033BD7000